jgi:choline-sulfatase
MTSKPNIVFIMSDQHDAAVAGCYGDQIVETPNLDALAGEGIIFDSHYCNSPICGPSRLSLTTGRYIHHIDAWSNECGPESDDIESLGSELQKVGYAPYLCGKMHYTEKNRFGFIEIPPYVNAYKKEEVIDRRRPDSAKVSSYNWEGVSAEFKVVHDYQKEGHGHDELVTNSACSFLENKKSIDDPFFVMIGYLSPHSPSIVRRSRYEKYQGRVPLPDVTEAYIQSLPVNYQQLRESQGFTGIDPLQMRFCRELYWAHVDWLDEQIGKLLQSLRQSEVFDNTVVVYSSDHGECKGAHGLWWKHCMFEESVRVPLIVRWPKRWKGGQKRSNPTSHVDLTQTLIEIAGGSPSSEKFDGESMVPLLDSDSAPWKNIAISQYYGPYIVSGMTMYRKDQFKYIYHCKKEGASDSIAELYNLESDPGEQHNLAHLAEYQSLIHSMHREMLSVLGESPEATELRASEKAVYPYIKQTSAGNEQAQQRSRPAKEVDVSYGQEKREEKVELGRFPDFICLGAHTAGVSWLEESLAHHPNCKLPEERALHYFDKHNKELSVEWYRSHFAVPEGCISGELTPAYAMLAMNELGKMTALMPTTKYVYLLRNPLDRNLSNMQFDIENGYISDVSLNALLKSAQSIAGISRNYARTIRKFDDLGLNQDWMLYLFYDEIQANPQKAIDTFSDFMNIPRVPLPGSQVAFSTEPCVWSAIPSEVLSEVARYSFDDALWLKQRFPDVAYIDLWISEVEEVLAGEKS